MEIHHDGNRDKFGVLVSENSIYLFIGNFTEHNWAESITCINHGNDETWTQKLLIPIEKQNQSVSYPDILPDTWFFTDTSFIFHRKAIFWDTSNC